MKRIVLAAWLLAAAIGCSKRGETPDPEIGTETDGSSPPAAASRDGAPRTAEPGTSSGANQASPGVPMSDAPMSDAPMPEAPMPDPDSQASQAEDRARPASPDDSTHETPDPEIAAALADLVDASDPSDREQAARRLESLGRNPTPIILPYTQHADVKVRRGGYFFLVDRFQPTDPSLVKAFSRALEDDDATIRRMGLQVLRRMRQEDVVQAIPQIVTLLERERADEASRANVARLLGKLESQGQEAEPALQKALSGDPSERVRAACAFALSQVSAPEQAATVLGRVLKEDSAQQVRYVAAVRLGRLEGSKETAAKQLAPALQDASEEVREAAAEGLLRLGSAAVPALIEQLKAEDLHARKLAAVVLGRLGSAAKEAAAPLKAAAAAPDADDELKKLVNLVLQRMGQ